MEKGLLDKTGKELNEWIEIVKKENFEKHGQIIKFLKTTHDMTHGFANFVALKTLKSDAGSFSEEDLITTQYKGKEALLPIYEKLIDEIKAFGNDIEIVPKKASVSLITKKQFALIQPSTKTRVDLGIKIKDRDASGRLETSGPFGAMCTHRVQITEVSQVDEEVIGYLKEAYEKSK